MKKKLVLISGSPAKKVRREKRIPFEVSIDPFYNESNINYLRRVTDEIDTGKAKLEEHNPTEDVCLNLRNMP